MSAGPRAEFQLHGTHTRAYSSDGALVPDTMANVSALGNADWFETLPQSFGAAQAA